MFITSILLIIGGTVFYELLTKTASKRENPYKYLSFSYLIVLIILFSILQFTNYDFSNLIKDFSINSVLAGASAMVLTYALLLAYRNGWELSELNIIYSFCVMILLLIIGLIFFKESITLLKFFGCILCLISLLLTSYNTRKTKLKKIIYYISVLVLIFASVGYAIFQRITPVNMNPVVALFYIYSSGLIMTIIFMITDRKNYVRAKNIISLRFLAFGFSCILVDAGFLFAYRNGWNIYSLNIVSNSIILIILTIVSRLIFKEKILLVNYIGMLIGIIGLSVIGF